MIERLSVRQPALRARRRVPRLSGREGRRARAYRRRARARRRRRSLGSERVFMERRMARAEPADRRAEAAGRRAGARVLRPAVRSALGLRRHRHQRQDFLQPVDRGGARPARHQGRRASAPSAAAFRVRSTPLPNTTPDALELHATLKKCSQAEREAVAMEVSSHGLVQGRVNGVRFACALFTNLSHDHLDYHGTMQAYGAAKARLFDTPGPAVRGAEPGRRVRRGAGAPARAGRRAHHRLQPRAANRAGRRIPGRGLAASTSSRAGARRRCALPVLGRFNVSNALGVLGCLVAKGIAVRGSGARCWPRCRPVPGPHAGGSAKSRWW